MNIPHLITNECFQQCWIEATKLIQENKWNMFNLVVQIQNPHIIDKNLHQDIDSFFRSCGLLTSKQVAWTIFPDKLYKGYSSSEKLYDYYLRHKKSLKKKGSWGTYFNRMISYEKDDICVNQLNNIINAINNRTLTSKAAYTIVIEKPGKETIRPLGAPCLNYLAIQLTNNSNRKVGLLFTYRNHDFLKKAYGNYLGLCNLLKFIATETNSNLGPITCISSHAYVDSNKRKLDQLLRKIS